MNVEENAYFGIETLRVLRHAHPLALDDEVEPEELIHGRFVE
jgi:hypothetical protein